MSYRERLQRLESQSGGQIPGERIGIAFGTLEQCALCGALIIPVGFDAALSAGEAGTPA